MAVKVVYTGNLKDREEQEQNRRPVVRYVGTDNRALREQQTVSAPEEEKEESGGKFSLKTAAKDAAWSLANGVASLASAGAWAEDLVGGALDVLFKDAGFKGSGIFNTLYNGDTKLAKALGLTGIRDFTEQINREAQENAKKIKTGNDTADKILQKAAQVGSAELPYAVGGALPMAAEAMLSGGTSVLKGLGDASEPILRKALEQAGTSVGNNHLLEKGAEVMEKSGILQKLSEPMQQLFKKREYWTSFAQEVGQDYYDALDEGATEEQAHTYAIGTALINSVIEIGGGIQNPGEPLWKSALEEGREEIEQGPIGQLMQNVVLGKDHPLFSTEDSDAVINPATMAEEFAMGAAVGGILGGGQRLIERGMNTAAEREAYRQAYGGSEQALLDEGKQLLPEGRTNPVLEKMQKKLDRKGRLSGKDIRTVLQQNEAELQGNDRIKIKGAEQMRLEELGESDYVEETAAEQAGQKESAVPRVQVGQNERDAAGMQTGQSERTAAGVQTGRRAAGYDGAQTAAGMRADMQRLQDPSGQRELREAVVTDENGNETRTAIRKVTNVQGGKVTMETENGRTVDAGSVSLSDGAEAIVQAAARWNMSADTVNDMLNTYRADSGLSGKKYALAAEEAYCYGSYHVPFGEMSDGGFAALLPEGTRKILYNRGSIDSRMRTYQQAGKAQNAKKQAGRVILETDAETANMKQVQRAGLELAEVLAEFTGGDVHVYESIEADGERVLDRDIGGMKKRDAAPNGFYRDGELYIDLNAGNNGEGVVLYTLAHEYTHMIRQWSGEKFRTLADFLFDSYGEAGVSVSELIESQQQKARRSGRDISYDTAYEEVVADAMEQMLSDPRVAEKIQALQQKDRSLWEKLKDLFRRMLEKFKAAAEAYAGYTPGSRESAEVQSFAEETRRKLADLYAEAFADMAAKHRGGKTATENRSSDASARVQYQRRESKEKNVVSIKEQIKQAEESLNEMEPVAVKTVSYALQKMNMKQKRAWAESEIKKTGSSIDRKGYGKILIDASDINNALNYIKTDGEIAAFSAVPAVIKRGMEIHKDINHKGRNFNTVTFSAPVVINGVRGNMAVVVRETGKNRYDMHRIVMPDGSAFVFEQKANTVPTAVGSITEGAYSPGEVHPTISTVSDGSIRQSSESSQEENSGGAKFSQRDSTGRKLTEAQQEYFKDSKVRDSEGRLMVMYHGTRAENGDFTVFDYSKAVKKGGLGLKAMGKGNYFTSKPLNGTERFGSRVIKAYINIVNPFVYNNEYGDGVPLKEQIARKSGVNTQEMSYDELQEFMRQLGYDGVVEYRRNGELGVAVAFDSSQIKNVDNTTPTKDPDIRFSLREQFPSEIDQWNRDGRPEGERFTLGSTGPVLQGLGAIESDIYMEGDKIGTILRKHPEMTLAEIKKIPRILEDPALVLKSKGHGRNSENSRLVCLDLTKAQNGQPVMTIMDLRPREHGFIVDDLQKVNSAYTKKNLLAFAQKSEVLYADKKRTIPLLRMTGLTIASQQLLRNGYIGSISYSGSSVNMNGVPFSSVVKISEDGGEGTLFSQREKYWRPSLSGEEWSLLNRRMSEEIESGENFVDESTKWVYADEKGVQVFALYGVGDGTEATPLYAVGGKKAIQAEKRLQERMREFERYDGDGETVDSLLESIRSEKRRSDGNIAAYGNGEAAKRAAELYGGQQDRNAGDAAGRGAADQRGVTEQTGEESTLYLERDPEAVDNRTLLANALESAVQNETEAKRLAEYRGKIQTANELEAHLREVRKEIRELSFAKGPRDMARLKALREDATMTANRINTYDRMLLRLEASTALKNVVVREKLRVRQAERQRAKEGIKAARESMEARQERQLIRKKLDQTVSEWRQMLLRPTKARYAPEELVKSCLDVALMLDDSGPKEGTKAKKKYETTGEALAYMKRQYDQLSESEDQYLRMGYEPEFSRLVDQLATKLNGKALRDLTLDEAGDVAQVLLSMQKVLKDARYQIGQFKKITTAQVVDNAVRQLSRVPERTKTERLQDAAARNTASTMRNIRRICQYDDNAELYKLFQALDKGVKKKDMFVMEASKQFDRFAGERMRKAATEVKTYKIGLTEADMTEMQVMQLILSAKREMVGKTRHIEGKGIIIPDQTMMRKGKGQDAIYQGQELKKVSLRDILRLERGLDDWAREYMKAADEFFNGMARNAINEATVLTQHRRVAMSENYIPFEVDKNTVAKEIDGVKYDATIEGDGMLKSVVSGAGNPLIIRGLDTILENHMERVGRVYGLAVPVRNFNRAYNAITDKTGISIKQAIGKEWGAADVELIEQAVADLQTSRTRATDSVSRLLNKGNSKFVEATLLSNISVTIKQAASYSTGGLYLSQKALFPYQTTIAKLFANNNSSFAKKLFAEIDEHTAMHYMRRKGMSMQEAATIANDKGKVVRWMDKKLPDAANPLKWIQNMDVATTAALWLATKKQVEMDGVKTSDATYWQQVTQLYEKVISETQPMYDVLHRPEVQKTTNELVKSLLMFRTQPLQNAGILYDAAGELAQAKKSKDAKQIQAANKKFRMAVTSQVASLAVFATMTLLAYAVRNRLGRYRDDEEELTVASVVKRVLGDMAVNGAQLLVPIGGSTLAGLVEKQVTGSRYGGELSVPTVDAINDWLSRMNKVQTDIQKKAEGESADLVTDTVDFALDTAGMLGIPAENVFGIIRGIVGNITDWTGHRLDWATDESEPSVTIAKACLENGHLEKGRETIRQVIELKMKAGKTEKEAKSAVRSSLTAYYKKLYLKAYRRKDEKEMLRIRKAMQASGVYDDGVGDTVSGWVKKWAEERKEIQGI